MCTQACDSDDDGLFGFDVHSDGDGQRFVSSPCAVELCIPVRMLKKLITN